MEDRIRTLMERVKSLSNNELIEMVTNQAKDYTPEAVNIANGEITKRGGLDKIKTQIEDEKIKKIERIKSLSNSELIEIITTKPNDYTPEEFNIAKEEVKQRGGFDTIKKQIDVERRKQKEILRKQKLEEENNIRKRIEETTEFRKTTEINETELLVRKRHKAIRGLMRFGNFIGWILCISILFLPIGLTLLYLGHMTLASIETEQNTRDIASLIRENFKIKQI